MGMMCAQMWIRGSVTMRQYPVILSPRCLKINYRFVGNGFYFKIFRNRICINTIAKALYNKFKNRLIKTVVRFQDHLKVKMLNLIAVKVNVPSIVSNNVCSVAQFYST